MPADGDDSFDQRLVEWFFGVVVVNDHDVARLKVAEHSVKDQEFVSRVEGILHRGSVNVNEAQSEGKEQHDASHRGLSQGNLFLYSQEFPPSFYFPPP